jgi:hypothetical protein
VIGAGVALDIIFGNIDGQRPVQLIEVGEGLCYLWDCYEILFHH